MKKAHTYIETETVITLFNRISVTSNPPANAIPLMYKTGPTIVNKLITT